MNIIYVESLLIIRLFVLSNKFVFILYGWVNDNKNIKWSVNTAKTSLFIYCNHIAKELDENSFSSSIQTLKLWSVSQRFKLVF